ARPPCRPLRCRFAPCPAYSPTLPPAFSMAALAPAVASRPFRVKALVSSPLAMTLACFAVDGTRPAARRAAKSTSPASSSSSWYSLTSAVSTAVRLRKPIFGRRMCMGIWPPSKPALILPLPERAKEPLWPRPAVLPRPEPMPRPTRLRSVRAPSAGERVFRRMVAYSSTRTRQGTLLIRPRTCGLSFSSRTSLSLFRPSARTDSRCLAWLPRRPLASRTLTVPLFSVLAIDQFLALLATLGRDARRGVHLRQATQGGAHQVDRVARADGLGQHVAHAHRLEHGAHGTARDHAGTLGGRLHVHARRAVAGLHRVPQGAAVEVDGVHVLAGLLHRLLDGDRHLACLAVAEADLAVAVAHHRQRGEGELATTLDGLADAVDRDQLLDHPVVDFLAVAAAPRIAFVSHGCFTFRFLTAAGRLSLCAAWDQNCRPPSRAASASALTRPW